MVGRNRSEGEKGAKWRNGSTSRHECLALAVTWTCCFPFCSGEKGMSSGLVGWLVVYPSLERW